MKVMFTYIHTYVYTCLGRYVALVSPNKVERRREVKFNNKKEEYVVSHKVKGNECYNDSSNSIISQTTPCFSATL